MAKKLPHDWSKLYIPASWVAAGIAAFLTSFFWMNDTFAKKEAVVIAQIKADILLDKQMEGLLRQINIRIQYASPSDISISYSG